MERLSCIPFKMRDAMLRDGNGHFPQIMRSRHAAQGPVLQT
jgi:hypothetical protein